MLDLKHRFVGQHLGHELGIKCDLVVRCGVGSDLIEEFAEIVTDWKIDEDLLVKGGVIITIHGLHILELGEVTKGVSVAHQILNRTVRLESLDNVDNVLDLIAVEHASEELVERVRALADEILNLSHQLLFHVHTEQLHVESILALTLKNSATVVSLLHDDLELSHVVVSLETSVDFLR